MISAMGPERYVSFPHLVTLTGCDTSADSKGSSKSVCLKRHVTARDPETKKLDPCFLKFDKNTLMENLDPCG